MKKTNYNVIGLMSGTSLDGLDLAHIQLQLSRDKWTFKILECETIVYTAIWIDQLKKAINYSDPALIELNINYTELIGSFLNNFLQKYKIENLDAICSHGHTILHQPDKGFTLQIGNLPELAKITNQTVVCDFRVQDVELGGQGAPLVPIGDQFLFSEYDYCLNLGGFSNISFESNKKRIAFDISPVNTVLNFYANQMGLDYDNKGKISRTGSVNTELLNKLNELDFYHKSHPKSLGVEFVKEIVLPIIEARNLSVEDKLRTFTEHIAIQFALALPNKKGKLLLTGGGAYNDFLIERMKVAAPQINIAIPSAKILEYKEALIFALLGVLKLRNEINVLSSVTGAKNDHSSGLVYLQTQS